MMYRIVSLGLFFVLVFGVVSWRGAQREAQAKDEKDKVVTVKMIDNEFDPKEIKIKVGESIIWENKGAGKHTATSDVKDLFDTGDVKSGDKSKAIPFNKTGEYPYHCIHDSKMKGKIIVE
jgi:plastocyanin